jgi:predicted transcriptional regulator of viral defense system
MPIRSEIMRSEYTNDAKGIDAPNRALLDKLVRAVSGPFTPVQAARLLDIDVTRSRKLLAYLASRGWLSRIRSGLYTTIPLGATSPKLWREDPWVVAATSFAPCYIAGWSAAEHWQLTEQIFRDVVVTTAAPVRNMTLKIQDTSFRLRHRNESEHFGLSTAWRHQTRVKVSDPTRTLIDVLDDPAIGGGIRHVAEMLHAYFLSEHRDDGKIIEYADRLGNRTTLKRLGFLVQALEIDAPKLVSDCLKRVSSGLTKLDPTVASLGRIVKRWGLRINVAVESKGNNP